MLESLFSKLDIFKFPVTFRLSEPEKASTFSGKLLTMLILAYILYAFITSDMTKKINPHTLIQDLNLPKRPTSIINKENFTFSIGLIDEQNFFHDDNTIFEFLILQDSEYNTENGKKNRTILGLEPCQKNSFKNAPEEFSILNMTGSYCFPEFNFEVSGYFDEEYTSYIGIGLFKCENSTENNFSCKSPEIIDEFLQGKMISYYITQNLVDADDYLNPIKKVVKNYAYYLDKDLAKSFSVYIKKIRVLSLIGFFFNEERLQEDVTISKPDLDIYHFNGSNPRRDRVFEMQFYANDQMLFARRKYKDVQTLLAEIGGILNVFIIIGFIIVRFEYSFRFTRLVGNQLYLYQDLNNNNDNNNLQFNSNIIGDQSPDNKIRKNTDDKEFIEIEINDIDSTRKFKSETFKKHEMSPKIEMKKIDDEEIISNIDDEIKKNQNYNRKSVGFFPSEINMEKSNFSIKNKRKSVGFLPKRKSSVRKITNLNQFIDIKNKEQYFPLDLCKYFKLLFKGKKLKLNLNEKLYLKGENQIFNELDIIEILKKLQEIEKLKRILLDENQLILFDILSKPVIFLDSKDEPKNLEMSDSQFSIKDKKKYNKKKILECYNEIIMKKNQSEIDLRMLKLIDNNVLGLINNLMK